MKIKLPIGEDYFHINSCNFCGIDSSLIIPRIDAKWNKHNLYFRSLIVDKENNVLSCGFPKFFNYGENPDCYPNPEKYNDWKIEEKKDGSLLICDYVNGQFSMRTRGSCNYKEQQNFKDFEFLPERYPKIIDFLKQNSHLSLLFEIITPNNIIVIRPQDVEFHFLGAINKNELCAITSHNLVDIWRKIGSPPVPQQYIFEDIRDLDKIAHHIKNWKGKEGVVLSYNQNQNKIKIKSDWYLFIHRIKSKLNSENNFIEYYVNIGMPDYMDFYKKIKIDFDYEIAELMKPNISKMCDAAKKVKNIVKGMKDFVSSIRGFNCRKEQAEHIISSYGKTNRASFVFCILDGKELNSEQLVKLMHQTI